jgi:hypothetical protein
MGTGQITYIFNCPLESHSASFRITYTKATHNAKVGPFEMSMKDRETVKIPVWAGVGAIVVGAVLLLVRTKA